MWKSSESTRRRRLQFDPLEGRQLLNGGYFQGPRVEMNSLPSGSNIGVVWVSAHEADVTAWASATPADSAPETRGRPLRQPWTRVARIFMRSIPGLAGPGLIGDALWEGVGWDRSSVSAVLTASNAVWAAQSSLLTQPGDVAAARSSSNLSGLSNPSGFGAGDWMTGTFSEAAGGASLASSASVGAPGPQGGPSPGGFDPADFLFQNRSQDQPSPLASMSMPPPSLVLMVNGMRDRTETSEQGTALAAPLNATVNPGAPSLQAAAPLGNTIGTAVVGAASRSAAGARRPGVASSRPQTHSIASETDSSIGDRTVSLALGSFPRGVLAVARGGRASGFAVVATTLSHSELAPCSSESDAAAPDVDDARPLPRGADLIAEALPFAGDSLERSLEDFVRQLRTVDVAGIVTQGPTPIVVASPLAVAGAAASKPWSSERSSGAGPGRGKGLRVVDSLGRELALQASPSCPGGLVREALSDSKRVHRRPRI